MMRELRLRFSDYLARRTTGVIGAVGSEGVLVMPVRCQAQGLEVLCLIPRWADIAFFLEQDPRAVLVLLEDGDPPAWVQVIGQAVPVSPALWIDTAVPLAGQLDDLYLVIRVAPRRLDRFDPAVGWGVRETVEL